MEILWWLPPICMVAVASHQRWRMRAVGQSAWKGGGFGMFSDIFRNSVVPRIWVETAGEMAPLAAEPAAPLAPVCIVPSPQHLGRYAAELAAKRWQRCGIIAHEYRPGSGAPPARVGRVSVRHIVIDLDAPQRLLRARTAADVEIGPTRSER